jgi:hypothetical protein
MRSLLAIVVVAALAFLGYRYLQESEAPPSLQQATQQAGQALQEAGRVVQEKAEAARAAVTGGLDLGQEVSGTLGELRGTLAGLTDPAKLQDALPSLDALETKLAGMQAKVEELPTTARGAVAAAVNESLPTLRSLSERVGSLQGGEPVKAKLDAIIDRLEGWAKPPA